MFYFAKNSKNFEFTNSVQERNVVSSNPESFFLSLSPSVNYKIIKLENYKIIKLEN